MNLSNLKPAKGSTLFGQTFGRGEGSGLAGTSGRGHKGAKSRSGYAKKFDSKEVKCHFKDVYLSMVLK